MQKNKKIACPECGELYAKGEDDRVDNDMKCGRCAYGFEYLRQSKNREEAQKEMSKGELQKNV